LTATQTLKNWTTQNIHTFQGNPILFKQQTDISIKINKKRKLTAMQTLKKRRKKVFILTGQHKTYTLFKVIPFFSSNRYYTKNKYKKENKEKSVHLFGFS